MPDAPRLRILLIGASGGLGRGIVAPAARALLRSIEGRQGDQVCKVG